MRKGLSASLMCIDFADTKKDIAALEDTGIEYLHFDIMDGEFVPNYALGGCMIDCLRDATDIPFDIHLMVKKPELKIPYLNLRQGDCVSVHIESTVHLQRVLAGLKQQGMHAGVAINPATVHYEIENVTDVIDFVLIMTVNPGYAGQALVEKTLYKIKTMRDYLDASGCENVLIEVDGNVNFENAKRMRDAGADIFVAGSSGLFRRDMPLQEAAALLRRFIY